MKFVECELHSPTKMSKLIGLAALQSSFIGYMYILYIYDCIGKIVVLTRATVFGLEKRDLKPVRGGKGLGNDGLGNPSQGQRIWQHLTWLVTQAAIPT